MSPANPDKSSAKSTVRSAEPTQNHRTRLDRQFARFLFVGVGNTVLSFVAYRLLLALGTPYVIAAALAFLVGAVNGYVFNRWWTFAARDSARARVVYVAIQVAGAASTSLLVLLFVDGIGVDKVAAYLAAIPPVTVSTFLANRVWTFADRS
jgi:putative flippase GtrA